MSPSGTAITGHPVARGGALAPPARLVELHRTSLTNLLVLGGTPATRATTVRSFHDQSCVRRGPFVTVRSGVDGERLTRSLLMGFRADRPGAGGDALSASMGGTLFIDEVERLPFESQRLLLEFLRGGRSEHPRDARWAGRVAVGGSAELESLAGRGRFHAPLFDAIDKIRVDLPLAH